MKNIALLLLLNLTGSLLIYAQRNIPNVHERKAISALIDRYSEAREKKDTLLLKSILTSDVDQLVSTGEWRNGISDAVDGNLLSISDPTRKDAFFSSRSTFSNRNTSEVFDVTSAIASTKACAKRSKSRREIGALAFVKGSNSEKPIS